MSSETPCWFRMLHSLGGRPIHSVRRKVPVSHSRKQGPSNRHLRLVYDGECPICQRYVRWQRIRRELGELELIDARQESEARRELTAMGINLDEGFALQIGEQWY